MVAVEKEVNTFLVETLNTYNALKSEGKDKLATQVLGLGSSIARRQLVLGGVRAHKVFCGVCGKKLTVGTEIEFFKHTGECIACDHVRGGLDHE